MTRVMLSHNLKKNYDACYDGGVSEWREIGAIGKAENILSLCKGIRQETVLEIGAGDGSVLKALSDAGFGMQLYALEISASATKVIKGRGISRLMECSVFDGYRVPYSDNQFDIAILSHVIEHVEHPRLLLSEALRCAKVVIVEVPLEDTLRLSEDFAFDAVGHINFYSLKTIRRLLQSCGMQIFGQVVANPPKAAYKFQDGSAGLAKYYVKQLLIRFVPRLATKVFTYHAAFICGKSASQAIATSN